MKLIFEQCLCYREYPRANWKKERVGNAIRELDSRDTQVTRRANFKAAVNVRCSRIYDTRQLISQYEGEAVVTSFNWEIREAKIKREKERGREIWEFIQTDKGQLQASFYCKQVLEDRSLFDFFLARLLYDSFGIL